MSPAISLLFVSFESGFLALCLPWYTIRARLWKSRQSRIELENSSKDDTSIWAGPVAILSQMELDHFQLSDLLP